MRAHLRKLSNGDLRQSLKQVVANERSSIAAVVEHIAEFEARKLYLEDGYSSMYDYCVHGLHLSEQSALKRIRAARLSRRFPAILSALADGRLHLTAVFLLKRHLTPQNAAQLLEAVEHKTRAQIELLLAERFPRQDVPTKVWPISTVDQLPPGTPQSNSESMQLSADPLVASQPECVSDTLQTHSQLSPGTPQEPFTRVAPLAPQRFALQTTLDQETHDLLREAQELLSHQIPSGEVSEVLKRTLRIAVGTLRTQKFAATDQPRKGRSSQAPRHIPASVKRAVWERDQGQCAFVSDSGHRCDSRKFLEFDHLDPVARGGRATVELTRLLCRAHNQFEAEQIFGTGFMDRKRTEARVAMAVSS